MFLELVSSMTPLLYLKASKIRDLMHGEDTSTRKQAQQVV